MADERASRSNRGWRRLSQFSMRTMLVLTTIAAVGIWWYQRTEPDETQLPGGGVIRVPTTTRSVELVLYHGRATAFDGHGRVLVTGKYRDGTQVGRWKSFHDNGRIAARTDVDPEEQPTWHAWHPNGVRQAVTTPLQTASANEQAVAVKQWYDNGRMREQGTRVNGRRAGRWTFWSRTGQIVSQGDYLEGLRHGEWQTLQPDGSSATVFFVRGVRTRPLAELLATVDAHLTSEDSQRCVEAVSLLVRLGPAGVERLTRLLDSEERSMQLFVLRQIVHMQLPAPDMAESLRKLSTAADEELATRALIARHAVDPKTRDASLTLLLAKGEALPTTERGGFLVQLVMLDPTSIDTLERILHDASKSHVHRTAIQLLAVLQEHRIHPRPFTMFADRWRFLEVYTRLQSHPDKDIAKAAKALMDMLQRAMPLRSSIPIVG